MSDHDKEVYTGYIDDVDPGDRELIASFDGRSSVMALASSTPGPLLSRAEKTTAIAGPFREYSASSFSQAHEKPEAAKLFLGYPIPLPGPHQ